MPPDAATIAENRFNELEAADAANDTPPAAGGDQPPADDNVPPVNNDNPNGGDDEDEEDKGGQSGDQEDPSNPQGEDPNKDPAAADGKPKGDEAPKELTDDELLAEVERRKLNQPKEDPEAAKQQPQEIKRPQELSEDIWSEMPPLNRHIYNQLPYITVRAEDGTTLKVKTREQIPKDFAYADDAEKTRVNDDMIVQLNRAEKLHSDITRSIQESSQQAKAREEAQKVVSDVERLQSEGVVPKIDGQPGTPEFVASEGVKLANKIMAYRQELAKTGDNVSVYTAGIMYKATHPDEFKPAPAPVTKSKADEERKAAARNVAGNGRGTSAGAKNPSDVRPNFAPGMSAADIADHYASQLD